MTDPGLPPRPRSLNLLESLVKEEEEKDALQKRGASNVVIPSEASASSSQELFDSDKQQITRENSNVSASFTEFKMKDSGSGSKIKKGNPNAGFKGKKMKKQRSRSNSADRINQASKKLSRPFSADYNRYKRKEISAKVPNDRPSTSRGRKSNRRTSSPKGQRPRSPDSYSSGSYSSDEEYIKKKKYRSDSDTSPIRKDKTETDSFFDSDKGSDKEDKRREKRRDSSSDSENNRRRSNKRDSSSDSYTSNDDDRKNVQKVNGHDSQTKSKNKRNSKTVYVNKEGHQRTRSDSESSDYQRMVVVEDYSSSSISSSEDEKNQPSTSKPPKPTKTSKPLLSRKKRQNYRIFQVNPDLYIEGKLHQKYSELDELLTCSFVDQKSHVTRHHLYQMELLRDQYQVASHGHVASATIIPRSLPGEIRNRPLSGRPSSGRPSSAKRPSSGKRSAPVRRMESDQESVDNAYGTLRSVMAAENARNTNMIRTDILADRPLSGKRPTKRKKKISATLKAAKSDTEEETSERPSFASSNISKTDSKGNSSLNTTPRSKTASGIDHHIKYTENEKLKRWLKEKDKIYRQQSKEERRKKREEREKLINEANDKIEKRIKSQKLVKRWMKEKNKELHQKCKEDRIKEKEERERERRLESLSLPGDTMKIRPQSAPARRSDEINIDEKELKGGDTPDYVRDQIHEKRDIDEENKQAKFAQSGGPHPPQTKFIYKRPVAGKIKLKMQVRGKSPVAQKNGDDRNSSEKSDNEKEKDKAKEMRMSYDDWVKKKRENDVERKKTAARQREMAKSDPELERIIPALGKKRIEDKLNSRKRIDTGLKKFDAQANRSFGGAEFEGEAIEASERPRSAYRLESNREESGQPALSITSKQLQRPSTAPASRGRSAPSPKKSVKSPRQAVIPQKADKIMSQGDTRNPYQIPFPSEKGIPAHVAERQRRIFADVVTRNLDEIEQRALLNAELIKEGVSDEDIERYKRNMEAEFAKYKADRDTDNGHSNGEGSDKYNVTEEREEDKHPKITDLMYSPRKRDDSTDSSSDNEKLTEDIETAVSTEIEKEAEVNNLEHQNEAKNLAELDSKSENLTDQNNVQVAEDLTVGKDERRNSDENEASDGHSHYRTYENLNELNIESHAHATSERKDNEDDDLRTDIEKLRERVDSLRLENTSDWGHHHHEETERDVNKLREDINKHRDDAANLAASKIKIVTDVDTNVVGILKERKQGDTYPDPEVSEEPEISEKQKEETEEEPSSPREELSNSRKRVSFNEQTEVFQSFESTSTDTVTPVPSEIDSNVDGLDAQTYGDDFEDEGQDNDDGDKEKEDKEESGTTFITNPDDETAV